MTEKVRHIKGENKPRLCGATANVEPVGTNVKLPICKECQSIHWIKTGEVIE